MTQESMEDLVKRVVEEIREKDRSLDIALPFSIVVYDPQRSRMEGLLKTCNSLKSAVRSLYTLLKKEPTSTGEIFFYQRQRKTVYRKITNE